MFSYILCYQEVTYLLSISCKLLPVPNFSQLSNNLVTVNEVLVRSASNSGMHRITVSSNESLKCFINRYCV